MSKKFVLSLAAVAAISATSAMAQQITPQSYGVNVNIEVTPIISMWAGHNNVDLVMDGTDPGSNNLATFPSTLSVVNNVDARIDATVTSVAGLPPDIVPGGGIHFHIFNTGDPVAVAAAVGANAYNPAGAQTWNNTNLGATKTVLNVAEVGINASANQPTSHKPITYASTSPGEVPSVGDYDLTVTYTIIED